MASLFQIAAILVLLAAVAIGCVLTLLAMPGIWLIVGATGLYTWLGPQTGIAHIQWQTVIIMFVLAVLGEIAEFLAGVVGARRAGGSRRAAVYSLVGSLAGAIGGATAGIPIPVIGSALGAVIGGAVGAFSGAAIAEYIRGERMDQSVKVGQAAFWGRLLGTGAKTLIASILAITAIVGVCT